MSPAAPAPEAPDDRARLWLVRHGQTEWALSGRHTGRTDIPLTEQGRDEARSLVTRLAGPSFGLVLTSPRVRASETATLAGFPAAEIEPNLAEWDYGALEGLTTPTIRETHPGWSIWTGPWPGGETPDEVGRRVDQVIERARAAGGDVLLVSHGHLLRVLAARWLGLPPDLGRLFGLATATLSILGWDRENPVIETWNEACHRLEPGGPPG